MTIVLGTIAVMSGLMVITEKNTIHSVFYLVMSFVNSALMLIIWGVDYIGLLLIIVYVGAIAMLFLFVIMMINVKREETNRTRYVPIGVIISIVLIMEVYLQYPEMGQVEGGKEGYKINGGETNITMMGEMIYT
jgi:NADH-quinone oxidoreductase subunit J